MDKLNFMAPELKASKLFAIGFEFTLTYSRHLYDFNHHHMNKSGRSRYLSYRIPPNYHPIPLTFDQWLSITNDLALLIKLMNKDVQKDIEVFNLFWILFIKLDPNHQKMSIDEVLLYYSTL